MRVETSVPTSGPGDPGPYLRGVLPGVSWSGGRLPELPKLTADTIRAARVPAGVHLALTGTARAVELVVRVGERTSVPAPTVAEVFLARVAGRPSAAVPLPAVGVPVSGGVPGGAETTVPGPVTLRIPLPERAADEVVRVYLPEAVEVRIDSLAALDGAITPAPRGPLWVVYGDSITQGWSVTEAGLAWPSVVAERLGLDLVNLGFAGSARGELVAADVVGGSGAAAVALAWGTNAWSSLPTDAVAAAARMRLFLTALRQGLPSAPVVVVSPLVRPAAEDVPNRFGTTHAALRTALEEAVRRYVAATGDDRITLVPGRDLVPADRLPDGLHPDDEGQRLLAAGVTPHVAAGLSAFLPA